MRTIGMTLALTSAALLGACSRGAAKNGDDALKNDLALAAQAQSYQAQQFVSPNEQNAAATATAQRYTSAPRAPQSVSRAPAPARRSSARRTTQGTYGGSQGSSAGTYYPAPSAPPEPVRNTKRDAAIGAAAGAVIGATTSRDKVKGGLIGAAAGGILGGIIGHTVDVHTP
jgi:hypothetical protein